MLTEPIDSLEAVLPLTLVREHVADADTGAIDEGLLALYREAAFEACEQYVGITFRPGLRQVQEELTLRRGFSLAPTAAFHRLKEPASTGLVAVTSAAGTQQVQIAVGGRQLPLWMLNERIAFGGASCEFGRQAPMQVFVAVYMTGDERPKGIPAGIKLGMLKFIAWSVTNAGDTLVTQSGSLSSSRETQQQYGSNNVAVSSGAVDLWRPYRRSLVR